MVQRLKNLMITSLSILGELLAEFFFYVQELGGRKSGNRDLPRALDI